METGFIIMDLVVVAIAAAFFIGGLLEKDRKQRKEAILGGFILLGAMSLMNFTYGVDCIDHIVRPTAICIGIGGFAFSVIAGYITNAIISGSK